jgi:hypothetical protein
MNFPRYCYQKTRRAGSVLSALAKFASPIAENRSALLRS